MKKCMLSLHTFSSAATLRVDCQTAEDGVAVINFGIQALSVG
jgi:hypothetical protein